MAGSVNKESSQYNDKKEFIGEHGAIKPNEIGFWEGVRSDVDRDVSTVKGGISGIATGVVNTVTGVVDYLSHPIDNTKALIDGTIDAASHPIATGEKAISAVDQVSEIYNTSIDLYRMQHDEGAEAEYKSGILGEIVGSGGVGAAAKKGIGTTIDAAKALKEANAAKQAAEVAKQKQMVENNFNVENPSFGDSAVRDFTATVDHPVVHRAENINAGQVTDRDGLVRVDEKLAADPKLPKTFNDQQVNSSTYHPTGYPAWKEGTLVTDRVVTQPEKVRMVIDENQFKDLIDPPQGKVSQQALGGWATKDPVNSVSDMRNNLAVTQEFKPDILNDKSQNKFYLVEIEVQPSVGLREGTAGSMYDYKTGKVLSGNSHQINFVDKSPYTNPELYKINTIKEIK